MKAILLGCGALATRERSYTSLLVEASGRLLLFDSGESPVRKILWAGYEPLKLKAVFLTHAHADHLYALPILIHELMLRGIDNPVNVFFPEPMRNRVEGILKLFFEKELNLPELKLNGIKLEGNAQVLNEEGLEILSTPVDHSLPTLAYKLKEGDKSLVYAPDVVPSPGLTEFIQNADLLFHDASYLDNEERARKTGHSTVSSALEDARLSQVRKVVLVHLGPEIEEDKTLPGEVVWGRDMLTLEI